MCNGPYLDLISINAYSKSINFFSRYWVETNFDMTQLKINRKNCNGSYLILSIPVDLQNLIEIHQLIQKILSINKILMSTKGHNSAVN